MLFSRSWTPDGAVKIPMQESGPQSKPPISIPSMFSDTVERYIDDDDMMMTVMW